MKDDSVEAENRTINLDVAPNTDNSRKMNDEELVGYLMSFFKKQTIHEGLSEI